MISCISVLVNIITETGTLQYFGKGTPKQVKILVLLTNIERPMAG
jgi:hypothetical protein